MAAVFIPPLVAGALGAAGAVALFRLVAREWRRINAELHPPAQSAEVRAPIKLRRDPQSGIYRPE
jgi:hypothetical protein